MFLRIAFFLLNALLAGTVVNAQVVSEPVKRTMRTTKAEVVALAVAPKGDRLLVGLNKGAELYDLESGKRLQAFPFNEDGGTAVYYVAFNENGEYVVLIGHSGKRVVYDVKTGKPEPSLQQHRWVPDPRAVKTMGFDMKNSTFDRFYQQSEARHGDMTVRAGKHGIVEFVDAEGKVVQKLEYPENKDQHHRSPLLFWQEWFITGTDDGRVLFYDVR
jgi:WD40 repeat protein